MLCRGFVLFENQVALNSASNRIYTRSINAYGDMVVTELAEPVRWDWGVSPRGNSRRARLARGGASEGPSAIGVGARKT